MNDLLFGIKDASGHRCKGNPPREVIKFTRQAETHPTLELSRVVGRQRAFTSEFLCSVSVDIKGLTLAAWTLNVFFFGAFQGRWHVTGMPVVFGNLTSHVYWAREQVGVETCRKCSFCSKATEKRAHKSTEWTEESSKLLIIRQHKYGIVIEILASLCNGCPVAQFPECTAHSDSPARSLLCCDLIWATWLDAITAADPSFTRDVTRVLVPPCTAELPPCVSLSEPQQMAAKCGNMHLLISTRQWINVNTQAWTWQNRWPRCDVSAVISQGRGLRWSNWSRTCTMSRLYRQHIL